MKIISRRNEEILFRIISLSAATFSAILLFFIIGFIILKAIPAISLPYYLTAEGVAGGIGSAIGNAIIGTIYLSVFATLIAAPFAVTTAIYLSRFASDNKITRFFRFLLEVLSGTPSIVLGIFGLLIIVIYFKTITGGFSLISGAIALAILIIPVIERATEEAINTVDYYLEEGSYALGATKWQTIRGITIPSALTGILTGMILGLGRAAEESAVVILTAGYSQFIPEITIKNNQKMLFGIQILPFQEVVGTLSISVYNAYAHSNIVPEANGFAAAFILIVAVLLINLTAKAIMWGVFGSNLMKKLRVFNLKPTLKEIPSTTVPNSFPKKNPPNAINSNQYPKSKADWRLALTQPIPVTTSTVKEPPRIPDRIHIPGKNVEGLQAMTNSSSIATAIDDLLDETPYFQTDILEFSDPVQSNIEPTTTENSDQNTQVFLRYSQPSEEFAMFEERPAILPERDASIPDKERWRLIQKNREENSCP